MRKFGLALCAVLALGVSASAYDYYEDESELPRWKTSLGIMGGVLKLKLKLVELMLI